MTDHTVPVEEFRLVVRKLHEAEDKLFDRDERVAELEAKLSVCQALSERRQERVGILAAALREMAEIAPTGSANVVENRLRQEIHLAAIKALGLPEPDRFVPSHYWMESA